MFTQLSDRLRDSFNSLRGRGRLTEDNIKDALREVRIALLEADVALPVVKAFVDQVRQRAVGVEVMQSLTPGQAVIKVVHDELVELMGTTSDGLDLSARPPAVILLAGLQGAGKTTTAGKLAFYLKDREKKHVALVSADIYRPAAIEQLKKVAGDAGAEFIPSETNQNPVDIVKAAITQARNSVADVLIVDTAGRLHVDEDMMSEVIAVHKACEAAETLFVVDSMTGQDAVNSAKAFEEALPLTGVILTKTDGDARGGAALSIRKVSGKPIKFMGTGEGLDKLEAFHPDRVASRILGMGDVVSLVEEVERKVDKDKAEKIAKKISKGKGFDLEDFRDQIKEMENMGGIAGMVDKLPGMGNLPSGVMDKVKGGDQFTQIVAIINSMTPRERRFPDLIRGSRKRRIAQGSGTQVQDVNRLLKQYTQMQKMMKRMKKKGGMKRMMAQMGQMGGMPNMPKRPF